MRKPELIITPGILRLIAEIDEFKGKWAAFKNLSPDRLTMLRKIATIESIASSTRIEGVTLSNQAVEVLLSNLKHQSFSTRDEQEVAGYAEAMDLVFAAYQDLSLTENHLKQLHQLLLKYSTKDERHQGKYKTVSNSILAFDADGQQMGVIFETTTPFATPLKMAELVYWTNQALQNKIYHDLLIIAVFIVVFLAIHPFQDGNGRLSRILTTLLLLRSGYTYVPYASLESIIEENKDLYYKALRRTQITLTNETPDWEIWIVFFLRCLQKQQDNLASKLEHERILLAQMPALSGQIIELLKKNGRLGISDIETLTGANKNTIKVRLRELVKAGHIHKHGKARGTWYILGGN